MMRRQIYIIMCVSMPSTRGHGEGDEQGAKCGHLTGSSGSEGKTSEDGQQGRKRKNGAKFEKNVILFDDSRGERGIFCTLT